MKLKINVEIFGEEESASPSFPFLPSCESLVSVKGNLDRKKIVENLDFVRKNFIRKSTKAGVRGCSAVKSQEKSRSGALF